MKPKSKEFLEKLNNKAEQGGVSGDTLPIGAIMPYPKTTAPENWLICDGSAVSRTTYSELFNVIGETFGTGDGTTTFNLPDIKQRAIVGLDVDDTDFNEIGKTLGEKEHTLTEDEIPNHKHTVSIETKANGTASSNTYGSLMRASDNDGDIEWKTNYSTCSSTGGDQPHNNIPPSIVQNFVIKAKQSAGLVANVVDNLESTSTTDALSANQGKELNEKINNFSSKILWTNPDSTSTMDETTISLTSDDYDMLKIVFLRAVGQDVTHISEVMKGLTTSLICTSTGQNNCWIRSRNINFINDTSIKIEKGYLQYTTEGRTEEAAACVPLYIIGYKLGLK